MLVNKAKWMRKDIQRNAILLFTSPLQRDTAAGALLISRCIAVPGDTVLVHNDGYRINGKEYPLSPNTLRRYSMQKQGLKFFIHFFINFIGCLLTCIAIIMRIIDMICRRSHTLWITQYEAIFIRMCFKPL